MTPEELFTAALGLGRQWRVAECRFEGEPKRLELRLEHVPGEHFQCPVCKASCGVHDTIERRWRHMNFFQYRCELVARVPRTWCRTDGVHQVPVPWVREGSGFILMMEALVMMLSAEMPVDAMADLLDQHDTRLWRVLMHYVEQAHAQSDWSAVRRIAIDETSARRGRRYVNPWTSRAPGRVLIRIEPTAAVLHSSRPIDHPPIRRSCWNRKRVYPHLFRHQIITFLTRKGIISPKLATAQRSRGGDKSGDLSGFGFGRCFC